MYAGFDVGGTHARVCLFDESWQVLATSRALLREDLSPQGVSARMIALLDEVLATRPGASRADLTHLGVGFAGQLDVTGQLVLNAPNLGWRQEPFAQRLAQDAGLAIPVRLVNDLNALLYGELVGGAVRGQRDVLAVYVGTGIGAAIVSGGVLVEGATGVAAELGHMKVVPNGRLCGCGEHGCVEAYAGGVHLERQVAALVEQDASLEPLRRSDALSVDLAKADALSASHEGVRQIWERATDYLALTVANSVTLLNPGVVLLGGGVLTGCPNLRDAFLAKMSPLVLRVAREPLELRWASRDDAGMLGAASLAAGL